MEGIAHGAENVIGLRPEVFDLVLNALRLVEHRVDLGGEIAGFRDELLCGMRCLQGLLAVLLGLLGGLLRLLGMLLGLLGRLL